MTSDIGHSPVKYIGGTFPNYITVTVHRYGSGEGTYNLYIRGQTTEFTQDAGLPSWELYTKGVNKGWSYVQVRVQAT
jgi:hypothetical protein